MAWEIADLMERRVAVIVAVGNAPPSMRAVQAASATTPIVGFVVGGEHDLLAGFNRPGGNGTGVVACQGVIATHDGVDRAE
jgi:hypothetical protein